MSQYQDKYFLNDIKNKNKDNMFKTLAGNQISQGSFNHNNMNVFYGSKNTGGSSRNYNNVLDNYTGQGTYDIKKEEVASFFKPAENLQNVYGNQNQNDFFQSRVNQSNRFANTKPWEEIKDTPGLGLNYNDKADNGLNNYNEQRSLWQPKNVDQLRASNNPKLAFSLDNHKGPAINPITNRGNQGKIIKKSPEGFFVNNNNLGMIAGAPGAKKEQQHSHQMMTKENRETTSVEYYGARGNGDEHLSYINGEYMDPHKQQLCQTPMINMSNNETNPTNNSNYGKQSYNILSNNRSTTKDDYFGNIGGMISNVVEPIVNGLRHTKKTNFTNNSHGNGNMKGDFVKQMVYNPNENISTTNREMYDSKLSMNHLNVQKQDGTAYMNTRPLLLGTNRTTTNQNETGHAVGSHKGTRNYKAEYNQKNNNKLYAENVKSGGNMSLFNNKVKIIESNKEICNNRGTPFYNPSSNNYHHPTQLLGDFTSMPQTYSENNSNVDKNLLKAFKENPYTHSLSSAV